MRADGVRVHLSTSAPLRTQAVFLFSFLEKPMTYAGLRVAPHDSCYDHYDGYLSLCVMRSPPLCFVGRAVQQQLPLGFIVEQSCNDKREKNGCFCFGREPLSRKKYGHGASGKHHSTRFENLGCCGEDTANSTN